MSQNRSYFSLNYVTSWRYVHDFLCVYSPPTNGAPVSIVDSSAYTALTLLVSLVHPSQNEKINNFMPQTYDSYIFNHNNFPKRNKNCPPPFALLISGFSEKNRRPIRKPMYYKTNILSNLLYNISSF